MRMFNKDDMKMQNSCDTTIVALMNDVPRRE